MKRKEPSHVAEVRKELKAFGHELATFQSLRWYVKRARPISELPSVCKLTEEVVVLCAGPSLPDTPVWANSGMTVFSLNRAMFKYKPTIAVMSSDPLILEPKHFYRILRRAKGRPIIVPDILGIAKLEVYKENMDILKKHAGEIFTFRRGIKHKQMGDDYETKKFPATWFYSYRTVLCTVIEIARFFGVKRVHVFGHDAKRCKKRIYCDDTVPPDVDMLRDPDHMLSRMAAAMQMGYDKIWKGRIDVINYCPDSATTCFPRKHPDEFPAS